MPLFDAERVGCELVTSVLRHGEKLESDEKASAAGSVRPGSQFGGASGSTSSGGSISHQPQSTSSAASESGSAAAAALNPSSSGPPAKKRRKRGHLNAMHLQDQARRAAIAGGLPAELRQAMKQVEDLIPDALAHWLHFFAEVCRVALPIADPKVLAVVHEQCIRVLWVGAHHDSGALMRAGAGAAASSLAGLGAVAGFFDSREQPGDHRARPVGSAATQGDGEAKNAERAEQWLTAFRKLSVFGGSGSSSPQQQKSGASTLSSASGALERVLAQNARVAASMLAVLRVAAVAEGGGSGAADAFASQLTPAVLGVMDLLGHAHADATVRAAAWKVITFYAYRPTLIRGRTRPRICSGSMASTSMTSPPSSWITVPDRPRMWPRRATWPKSCPLGTWCSH